MPEKQTLQRARRDRREGKAPSTQAGEFIREQSHREGKHGARSTKQAIAIGAPPRRAPTPKRARERSGAAMKAVRTKGAEERSEAARKAAHTREMHAH